MYALTEDIKKEDVKEEEATETTEEVVEEVSEPSELEEAQALKNISNMPARVKCAELAWYTMQKLLEK